MARHAPLELVLYAPRSLNARSFLPDPGERFTIRTIGEPRGSAGTLWEQFRVPPVVAHDRLDVWFAPAYTAPLRLRIPIVVAIHDISFVAHPEWFRFREGTRRRWLTARSAQRAGAIITISEFSRDEIISRLDVPEKRIHVIPPGIDEFGATTHDVRPRLLYVGSIFNRRHVTDLIRAFAPIAARHPDAHLDIVGDNRSYPYEDVLRTVTTEGLGDQVQWHQYVSDTMLRDLYAHARAFAFLSEYEGLGLTPLEALSAGVPPVLLDTPVAHETCGEAALYVAPHDLPATTHALESALFDNGVRTKLLAAAPAVLAKYSWPKAARETLKVLESVVSNSTFDIRHSTIRP
jgi:glycosyltransferase involved in cell wall biosynthesis